MAGSANLRVRGAPELERAFKQLRREVLTEIKPALRKLAEPVRVEAEQLSVREISNIGPAWSGMRIGATVKGVYIAPKRRRQGGSPRPNLAPLLLNRAMRPAVDEHAREIVAGLEVVVARSASKAGF